MWLNGYICSISRTGKVTVCLSSSKTISLSWTPGEITVKELSIHGFNDSGTLRKTIKSITLRSVIIIDKNSRLLFSSVVDFKFLPMLENLKYENDTDLAFTRSITQMAFSVKVCSELYKNVSSCFQSFTLNKIQVLIILLTYQ